MILLWGLPGDQPIAFVRDALGRLGADVAFLDQRAILDTQVELCVDTSVTGVLHVGDDTLDLSKVTAVYLRPYESSRLPAIEEAGPGSPEWGHALNVEDILLSWIEVTPALVVNPPTAMAGNASKPYQAAQIREHGFAIPATLVTTDPQAVLDFRDEHGTIIYKSVSNVRSVVSRLRAEHLDYLHDVASCPTQFQEYVPGIDYRVHVVGEELFSCEIVSTDDDYRYASGPGGGTQMRNYDLPRDCAERCRRLAAAMDLPVAGIDLRRSADGVWYCFEVNSSPGFSPFQEATNQPIDEAIARLLLSA
jgi:hypothetical protein